MSTRHGCILICVLTLIFLSCKDGSDKDRDGIPDNVDLCDSAPDEAVDGAGCPCTLAQDSLIVGSVQFFIDNSGSMKLLVGDSTNLRIALSTMIRNTRYALEQKKIAGDRYHFVSTKSQKTTYDIFYENLKNGKMLTAKSSPLMNMIESLLHQHDKTGLSVLISDCELVDQTADAQDLAFRNESIKRYAKDGSLIIYRFKDAGSGKYFYMMVFGRPAQLGWFDTKIMPDGFTNKADFGLTYGSINFDILNYTGRKGNWYISKYCRTIEEIEYGDSNSVTIGLSTDFSQLPTNLQSSSYLKKNLTVFNSKQEKITFEVFKSSEIEVDKDDGTLTGKHISHIILLTLEKGINTNNIIFGASRRLPDWVKALSNDSGRNLLLGINEAFSDADNNYFSMKLTIN